MGSTLFTDEREAELPLIQIVNPRKVSPRPKIFNQLNKQKINCRHQNTKHYLPVIMTFGFEETHDLRDLADRCDN